MEKLGGIFRSLQRYLGQWWYPPLVALLAGADAFILVVPVDALLVPCLLARPRRWLSTVLLVAAGSALGGVLLAGLVDSDLIRGAFFHGLEKGPEWARAADWMGRYGLFGLLFFSLGPLPQQPALVMAGLARLNLFSMFATILLGRLMKYGTYGLVCRYAPGLVMKIPAARRAFRGRSESFDSPENRGNLSRL
jgi:membrane protein YqaA with SNARE-associated domain